MTTAKKLIKAAGAAGAAEVTYVDDVFSTYLYTGDGADRDIVNGIDLAGEGGLVWIKDRSLSTSTSNHVLADTEQGATKYLIANSTSSVNQNGTTLTSFNNDGFSVGLSSSFNRSNSDIASWTFRKQPGFFDIVTYTGNGTAGRTVSHNLGSVPGMIIVKKTNSADDWRVFHRSQPNKYANLNSNFQFQTDGGNVFGNPSNGTATAPTSTHFTVDGGDSAVNGSGGTYVAYLFAHDAQDFGTDSDESIIKCGSYTGNGSTDGPTIDLGFEPQWLLIKQSSGSGEWSLFDSMRGIVVGTYADGAYDALIAPDSSAAEENTGAYLELNPTGFRLRSGDSKVNDNGETHIYMAIRRPHKPASELTATDLFVMDTKNSTGDGQYPTYRSEFPVDMAFVRNVAGPFSTNISSRMTGERRLYLPESWEEDALTSAKFDHMDGWMEDSMTVESYIQSWMWRRAPGFFDVVAYEGISGAQAIPHNLGVAPEMMWVKRRTGNTGWGVYHKDTGTSKYLSLNENYAAQSYSLFTATSDTTFSVIGNDNYVNASGSTYIAYLFASVPGISKVGSYTGTGNDLNVDCGFSSGARFVLIKRTDSSGQWYVWDSARGIVAGNEPYLRLNSSGAQSTGYDYIDPLSSGFTVPSTGSGSTNINGSTYIFYAIA